MGRTKRKEDKGEEKSQKRKRRRKARTDVSSDSDSSSEDEIQVTKENIDMGVEDEDTPMPNALMVEDDDEEEGGEQVDEQESTAKFTEKGGRIPSPLRDLHDPQAEAKFEEYYMRLMTEEFGDDLNKIREAKDFEDRSLPMLIRALKQGVNIFNAEEKRSVVKEMA